MKGCATCKIIAKKNSAADFFNEELDANITGMIQEMKDEYNNWNKQILKVVEDHPCLQFIWVNYRGGDFPRLPNLFSKDEKDI